MAYLFVGSASRTSWVLGPGLVLLAGGLQLQGSIKSLASLCLLVLRTVSATADEQREDERPHADCCAC